MNQEVEIFVSYAKKDKKLAQELLTKLRVLNRKSPFVYIWSPDYVLPGQEWKQAIRDHLEKAQIILPLVSQNFFFDSDYELSLVEKKQKTGTALVIPIILRPVDLRGTPFDRLQSLPAKGKALSEWGSRDLAYLQIVDELKEKLKTFTLPGKREL